MVQKKVKTLKKSVKASSKPKQNMKTKVSVKNLKKIAKKSKSSKSNAESKSIFKKRVETPISAPELPKKAKKNYKLPNYKKKCIECATFKFIKGGWSLCMQCYEKKYGKYLGEDRFLYVQQVSK